MNRMFLLILLIFISSALFAISNEQVYKGIVVEKATGETLPGATVLIKDSGYATITGTDGEFSINARPGSQVEISYVSMIPARVILADNKETLKIELEAAVVELNDVVVTGYFKRNKNSYTGNATTYTKDEMLRISSGNVLTTLSVIDPTFKLNINNQFGSDPNKIPEFTIQGSSNLQNEYSNTPNMPTFILDGFEVSAQKIFDLNPNRVKSITILKDAAATAIYGSRADNGIIVVETFAPGTGKIKVNYSFSSEFDVADLTSYNLMNAAEKLEYEKKAGLYTHSYAPVQEQLNDLYNTRLKYVEGGINTDWIKKPVNSVGFGHKHSLIVEGGSQGLRYALDLNYSNTQGVMQESGRNIVGIGIKLQYNTKKVRFINDMSFSNTESSDSPYGSFNEYTKLNPYYLPYDKNGNVVYTLQKAINTSDKNMYNPLYNATINTKDESNISDFTERLSIEWDVIKGLKMKANASISIEDQEADIFKPNNHTDFADVKDKDLKGSYLKSAGRSISYDMNISANYTLAVNKNLFNAVGIYNIRTTNFNNFSTESWNFPSNHFDHVSMGTQYLEGDRPKGFNDISRLVGFALNANYSYDNRFLADFSVRSDASSVFGANQRWGTFYAIGAGWNVTNEKWLKDDSIINLLKIRVSQGTTGGQNFYPYQSLKMFTFKDPSIDGTSYDGEIGSLLMAYGNPDLKWQITNKFNVGADFSLINDRLSGYINWYHNLTKDKLIDLTLAPSTGFNSYTSNLGNVLNKGLELNLKGTIIRDYKKQLRWDLFFNVVRNVNELRDISNALLSYNSKQDDLITDKDNPRNLPLVKYQEGMSINTIWANHSLGIDPATGKEIFLDKDGNKVNQHDVKNDKPIASTDPAIEGNFGTMLSYRNFIFNAYFAYSYGGHVYNQTLVDKIENVDPLFNGDKRILYDRWSRPGDIAKFKDISDRSITLPTSRFIEMDNNISLSSLSLSYQSNVSKLKDYGIEMIKISAIGNDLFRASTVEMERGLDYPFARTFSLNFQVTF